MELLKNKVFIISIALWCFITVVRILNHIPWFDEAHAWTIAEELNLVQIFNLMKVEGHTFIWYLLLMPFAKLHWGYPYVMQFLNWIFCFIALIILWKKAPFNNFIKVLITFSYPFLFLYSVYARCYSIGIMLLFLLTAMFEDKLKHPILYSLILVICANTSLMAMIGATAFGILFLCDFIKSKPDKNSLITSLLVLLAGVILVLIQIIGVDDAAIDDYKGINFKPNSLIGLCMFGIEVGISIGILYIIPMLYDFRRNIKPLFFLLFTTGILTYCFMFRFYGHYWNHSFYYIYFLLMAWLLFQQDNFKNFKIKYLLIWAFGFITFIHLFIPYIVKNDGALNIMKNGKENIYAKLIVYDKSLVGKKLIVCNNSFLGYMLLPYHRFEILGGNGIFNYNYRNEAFVSEYCYENIKESFANIILSNDRFITLLGDSESIYTSISFDSLFNNDNQKIFYGSNNKKYVIARHKCGFLKNKNYCLYKISKAD